MSGRSVREPTSDPPSVWSGPTSGPTCVSPLPRRPRCRFGQSRYGVHPGADIGSVVILSDLASSRCRLDLNQHRVRCVFLRSHVGADIGLAGTDLGPTRRGADMSRCKPTCEPMCQSKHTFRAIMGRRRRAPTPAAAAAAKIEKTNE